MANLPVQQNYALKDLELMSDYIVKSGLFGLEKKEEAMALLLLAQAEGLHPMKAIQKYNIVQGKPAKKAESMLADFLRAGGKVKWHELSDKAAKATFTAPNGDTITVEWNIEMANKITSKYWDKNKAQWSVRKLTDKDNWRNYPRAMLRSRVVSEGIRTVYPEIVEGVYTPEEVMDFEENNINEDIPDVDTRGNEIAKGISEQLAGGTDTEPIENRKLEKNWTIAEIKKIVTKELTEILRNNGVSQKQVVELFNKFNGNQEKIIAHFSNQNQAA